MKRVYVSIPELKYRHIICKKIHIINISAKESNIYVIITHIDISDWITDAR